jgi:hypothetical protein
MPSTDKLTTLREPNYAVLFGPILIPLSSLRLVLAFRELNSSSLPHSDVGHPFFAADVQRRYAEDAKVESSFSARCGISRCRGTVGIVALIEGRCCTIAIRLKDSRNVPGAQHFGLHVATKRIQSMGPVSRWTFKISTPLGSDIGHRTPSTFDAHECMVRL